MDGTPALRVSRLSKTFGSVTVLKNAQLELAPGEVHALVGENGSGKSTLVKILAGVHQPDPRAQIEVAGHILTDLDPSLAAASGLAFVHQELGLVSGLSCADNMGLGTGYKRTRLGTVDARAQRAHTRKAAERLGYQIDPRTKVADLSMSERTAIAVARALSSGTDEHVLVLDEPTANLPGPEIARLFEVLGHVRDRGVAILFISHHFDEVFDFADRVTVLRDGRVVASDDVASLDRRRLLELMTGRELTPIERDERSSHTGKGQLLAQLDAIGGDIIKSLSLDIAPGEIVGVAGITGSGREELCALLSGDRPRRGRFGVAGRLVRDGRPQDLRGAGIAYVPAERAANGLLPNHTVRENLTIGSASAFTRGGVIKRSEERAEVESLLDKYDVRPRRPEALITELSGGNQQKVMVARATRRSPILLILDEPTQGVDVHAQAEIHQLLRQLAAGGMAILACSSVSEELAELADRTIVLREGRVTTELIAPIHPDQITEACLAASAVPPQQEAS